MRLINSEDVKALINGLDSLPWEEEVDELIDRIPTAFDIDKVIKELESLVEDREEDIINDEYTFGECSAYESAIRVVKAGGIDES